MRGAALLLALPLAAAACGDDRERLVLATTTSVYDSGLLPELLAAFEARHPELRVAVLVVGTGEALALGRAGDVDVTITHHPPAESAFVADGYAPARLAVMSNDFVLAGPPGDPAGIAAADARAAFDRLARGEHAFVSRDDDSGTHRKELELWQRAGITPPRGRGWYVRAGAGMADALRLAAQRPAYVLADEATYEMVGRALGLAPLVTGDPLLANLYSAMLIARARHPQRAAVFVAWLTGEEGQRLIAAFGVERTGRQLFRPAAAP